MSDERIGEGIANALNSGIDPTKTKPDKIELTEKWRTGTKVPVNIYKGDRPIFQAHTEADAREVVDGMNALRATRQNERKLLDEALEDKVITFWAEHPGGYGIGYVSASGQSTDIGVIFGQAASFIYSRQNKRIAELEQQLTKRI